VSDLESFRTEARAWLEENCPPSMRSGGANAIGEEGDAPIWGGRRAKWSNPEGKLWLDRMGAKGWTAPTWPKEYGGGGLSPAEARVVQQEMARIKARPPLMSFVICTLGPLLLE